MSENVDFIFCREGLSCIGRMVTRGIKFGWPYDMVARPRSRIERALGLLPTLPLPTKTHPYLLYKYVPATSSAKSFSTAIGQ